MTATAARPNYTTSQTSGYLFLERIENVERRARNADGKWELQNLLVMIGRGLDGSKVEIITKNEAQRETIDGVLAKRIAQGVDILEAKLVIGYNASKVSYLGGDGTPTGRAECFLNEGADTSGRNRYAWFPTGETLQVLLRLDATNVARRAAAAVAVDCALVHAKAGHREGALMAALSFAEDFGGQKISTVEWPTELSEAMGIDDSPEGRAAVRLNMVVHKTLPALKPIEVVDGQPSHTENSADPEVADETSEMASSPVEGHEEELEGNMSLGGYW